MNRVRRLTSLIVLVFVSAKIEGSQAINIARFDRGNRYEGLVDIPIAGSDRPALDLISFTGFFEPFTAGDSLRVRFFLPVPSSAVRIVAQELSEDRFYRMESKAQVWAPNTWAVFAPWPTGDVIGPGMVLPSNIGVVVFLDDRPAGQAFVAPAFVERAAAAEITRYRLQLRPVRATLSAVSHTLERIESTRMVPVAMDRSTVERPDHRPFRIELDAASLPEGRYRLTIVGEVKNESALKVTRQYEFEHRRLPR
jgi:hypothetical protein